MFYISFKIIIILVAQIVGIGITCWVEYVLMYPIPIRIVVNCIQLRTKYGCNGEAPPHSLKNSNVNPKVEITK
jgi:purine-cytosine permease-like protein